MSESAGKSGKSATDGMSTLDLMGASGTERRIIRIMLRKPKISHSELMKQLNELPEEKRPSAEAVQEALTDLCDKGWLVKDEGDEATIYKVNLSDKVGSDQSRAKPRPKPKTESRPGPGMKDLWDSIDSTSDTDYRKRHSNSASPPKKE